MSTHEENIGKLKQRLIGLSNSIEKYDNFIGDKMTESSMKIYGVVDKKSSDLITLCYSLTTAERILNYKKYHSGLDYYITEFFPIKYKGEEYIPLEACNVIMPSEEDIEKEKMAFEEKVVLDKLAKTNLTEDDIKILKRVWLENYNQ